MDLSPVKIYTYTHKSNITKVKNTDNLISGLKLTTLYLAVFPQLGRLKREELVQCIRLFLKMVKVQP